MGLIAHLSFPFRCQSSEPMSDTTHVPDVENLMSLCTEESTSWVDRTSACTRPSPSAETRVEFRCQKTQFQPPRGSRHRRFDVSVVSAPLFVGNVQTSPNICPG